MLEAQAHPHSFFSTFTYAKEPPNGSLEKSHLSASFHRLRDLARRTTGRSVRFYAVGEYGETTHRPHYHAAIFGLLPEDQRLIDSAWQSGIFADGSEPGLTHHGTLTPDSAAYVAGYVTKKLADSPELRCDPRSPEFAVMSRRPGIGLSSLGPLVDALNTSAGALYLARHGDVPTAFTVGGRSLPLGTHVRGVLREFFFGDHRLPPQAKVLKERQFGDNIKAYLPAMPVDPTLEEALLAWSEASQAAYEEHHSRRRQRAVQLSKRKRLQSLKAKL